MTIIETCHGQGGYNSERRAVLTDLSLRRMGVLYGIAVPFIDRVASSFCIHWHNDINPEGDLTLVARSVICIVVAQSLWAAYRTKNHLLKDSETEEHVLDEKLNHLPQWDAIQHEHVYRTLRQGRCPGGMGVNWRACLLNCEIGTLGDNGKRSRSLPLNMPTGKNSQVTLLEGKTEQGDPRRHTLADGLVERHAERRKHELGNVVLDIDERAGKEGHLRHPWK
ncbi:hypothetical protein C8R44DRAFT_917660 [Mycena epipterygia]|nr:hypothetical protein C8R44DRAFT_917660 [Mycena epipterygia]